MSDALDMDKIVELQAETLRALANPRRLEILMRLEGGALDVTSLAAGIGLSQPNVSQHLGVLRSAGLVEADRNGRVVRYRISDPEVIVACDVMRRVLERRLVHLAQLSTAEPQRARDALAQTPTSQGASHG